MRLILETNNKSKIAKVIALAQKLNIVVKQHDPLPESKVSEREALADRILNFVAASPSSFGDAGKWQEQQRKDRDLPFSK